MATNFFCNYLKAEAPLTQAQLNVLKGPALLPVYGIMPIARAQVVPVVMLPPEEVERREREYQSWARGEYQKTIATMRAFGKDAMARWVPRGVEAHLRELFPKAA